MNRDNFDKLPKWMQELWSLAPSIARQAEKHINTLEIENQDLKDLVQDALYFPMQPTSKHWQRVASRILHKESE